jgi:hypothetical protein
LIGTALVLNACQKPAIPQASGVLINVESRQIVDADSVTLRTADGHELTFRVSPDVARNPDHPNTASHLRQHMLAGDPVTIRYRDSANGPEAVSILDGAQSAP